MDNPRHAEGGSCDARPMSAEPNFPISRSDARASGLSDDDLRRDYRRILRGQWLGGNRPATRDDLRRAALALAGPGAFLTHDSAGELYGGIVPETDAIHVGITHDRRVRTRGLIAHRYGREVHSTIFRGFPVTAKGQTFVDLATRLSLVDLVVFGDSLVQRSPAVLEEFRSTTAAGSRIRNIEKARRASELCTFGAESPYETRMRLLMHLAGLPAPVVQHPITNAAGREIYRLDLAYPQFRLAIEYDGAHHNAAKQRSLDLARREQIEEFGWKFVVGVASDLHSAPSAFLQRVMIAMAGVGMPRPRLSEEWRLHFSGRAGSPASSRRVVAYW